LVGKWTLDVARSKGALLPEVAMCYVRTLIHVVIF
jgi:hypothetical protein